MWSDSIRSSARCHFKHANGLAVLGLAVLVLLAVASANAESAWLQGAGRFRVALTVDAGPCERTDKPVDHFANFTALLAPAGQAGTIVPNSLRLVEVDPDGIVIDQAVPFQYDAFTDNSGLLVFLMMGTTGPDTDRHYHLYFDTHGAFGPVPVDAQIELTDDVPDEGMLTYRIGTPGATWFYQKDAGGFSSLLDVDGNDWLNFHPFGGSDGIYRGIPNLVHPDNIFHPGHANCTSEILHAGPLRVTIHTISNNGLWECLWDIYPAYARLTLLRVADKPYWFLYEGTPGGLLDLDTDFCLRSTGQRGDMTQSWTGDIPAPEWLYFEDANLDRYLFFVHEEDDAELDSFYQMENNMTVFGFGRSGLNKYLAGAPKHFTVGLADNADFATAGEVIEGAYQPVTVTAGDASAQTDFDADGRINESDLALFMEHWHETGPLPYDLTGDGNIDLDDLLVLLDYYRPQRQELGDLQGHWKRENDYNDVVYDASPYGRHGFVRGLPPMPASGSGPALEFDGSGDYVEIKGYPGVLGTQPRTVAAWIRTQTSDYADILSWGVNEPAQRWTLMLTKGSRQDPYGALRVLVGGTDTTGTTRLTDGQWHHIAVVLDAGETAAATDIVLYVDGRREAVSHAGDTFIDTAAGPDVTLGAAVGDGHAFFEGWMDEVRIYNRALTEPEIQDIAGAAAQQ